MRFVIKDRLIMALCEHPNFFFKDFKFYCRTCCQSEDSILLEERMTKDDV